MRCRSLLRSGPSLGGLGEGRRDRDFTRRKRHEGGPSDESRQSTRGSRVVKERAWSRNWMCIGKIRSGGQL